MFEIDEENDDGNEIASDHADDSTDEVTADSDDCRVGRWGILFLTVPLAGFVMYLAWRQNKPEKAKTAGCLALWGLALGIAAGFVKEFIDSRPYPQHRDYSQSYAVKDTSRVSRPRTLRRTYDLSKDWSSTENPNGAWSYNHSTSPITQSLSWQGHTGWGYRRDAAGCIIQLGDPKPSTPRHDMHKGDIVMHALSMPSQGDSKFVNVTWTSPAPGIIDLGGRAWDAAIAQDRDMTWSLMVGGRKVAQRSALRGISREDRDAHFNANRSGNSDLTGIPVKRGTRVEFRLATVTHYGHFAGIELQITLNTIALNNVRNF